jgi:hypothetical protein
MTTPVVFEPIEIALADWLTTALAARDITVPVVNAVPNNPRPPSYVLVLRPGGAQSNLITDQPRIIAEAVAEYGSAAADLAKVVRALISAAAPGYISDIWIDSVRDLGMTFSPDPDTNAPRYLINKELYVRGEQLL